MHKLSLVLLLSVMATATIPSSRANRRHPDRAGISVRWASASETAEYLGLNVRTVRKMVHDGRLTQYSLGPRLVRFNLDEIDSSMKPRIIPEAQVPK
jgi:excisionase family DNA binding protein